MASSGLCAALLCPATAAPAQTGASGGEEVRVSLVYTGRSLGALGVLRDPDEHELLIEEATRAGASFHLATHICWRGPGLTLFAPSADLDAADLAAFLAWRPAAEDLGSPALVSNNVTMIQDPGRPAPDLLAMTRRNGRAAVDFPDLAPSEERVGRARVDGKDVFMVGSSGGRWPGEPAEWTPGLVNRIDVGEATLYELAVNLGQVGPRATLIGRALADAKARGARPLVVDLGERDGDLGLERSNRARVDYAALRSMGYGLVVPYEFELALGAKGLGELAAEFPAIRFLASNVKPKEGSLFETRRILEVAGVKIGLLGLVDPDLQGLLAKSSLADFSFEPPVDAAQREIRALQEAGVDAIVALSNLHPRDNAFVAREVTGLDAIAADLHVRWSPEEIRTEVELPGRPRSRPGSPALLARSFANGLGVGRLDLAFRPRS